METNEIMANEEIVEMSEEIAAVGSGKGFKVAVGIGLAMITGAIAYKYVVKPMLAKAKAKKEQQEIDGECVEMDCSYDKDDETVSEEETE